MDNELASAILASARRIGADPVDLATAISFESAGTMNPDIKGGAGGKHLGLIQFSEDNQKKYGVTPGMGLDAHMGAVESYLKDRGFQPGMGMADLYSTINAGRPGLYNASDAATGGTPGSVADKVRDQMGPHRANAMRLLGMAGQPPATAAPAMAAPNAPMGSATPPMALPVGGNSAPSDEAFMAALKAIAQRGNEDAAAGDAPLIDFNFKQLPMARPLRNIRRRGQS